MQCPEQHSSCKKDNYFLHFEKIGDIFFIKFHSLTIFVHFGCILSRFGPNSNTQKRRENSESEKASEIPPILKVMVLFKFSFLTCCFKKSLRFFRTQKSKTKSLHLEVSWAQVKFTTPLAAQKSRHVVSRWWHPDHLVATNFWNTKFSYTFWNIKVRRIFSDWYSKSSVLFRSLNFPAFFVCLSLTQNGTKCIQNGQKWSKNEAYWKEYHLFFQNAKNNCLFYNLSVVPGIAF